MSGKDQHNSPGLGQSLPINRAPKHAKESQESSSSKETQNTHKAGHTYNVRWLRVGAAVSIICLVLGYIFLSVVLIMSRNSQHAAVSEMNEYQQRVSSLSSEQLKQLKADLDAYNKALSTEDVTDPFVPNGLEAPPHYRDVLGAVGQTTMGKLSIPKIGLDQPIHYGNGEMYLGNGVEHVSSTAIPDDVPGTNSVLAGHSGLDNTVIFDNLDQLEAGDTFQITILDWQLTYKVDNTTIVEPDAIEILNAEANQTYVSLLTCWPRYINSHRLIVRGVLVDAQQIDHNWDSQAVPFDPLIFFVVLVPLVASIAAMILSRKKLKEVRSASARYGKRTPLRLDSLPPEELGSPSVTQWIDSLPPLPTVDSQPPTQTQLGVLALHGADPLPPLPMGVDALPPLSPPVDTLPPLPMGVETLPPLPPLPPSVDTLPPLPMGVETLPPLPPLPPSTDSLPPLPMGVDTLPPMPMGVETLPPLPMGVDTLPPLPMGVETLPPLPMEVDTLPPLAPSVDTLPPLPMGVETLPPLPTEVDSLPPLAPSVDTLPPTEPESALPTPSDEFGGDEGSAREARRNLQRALRLQRRLVAIFWIALVIAVISVWMLFGLLVGSSILPGLDLGYSWFDSHIFFFFGV